MSPARLLARRYDRFLASLGHVSVAGSFAAWLGRYWRDACPPAPAAPPAAVSAGVQWHDVPGAVLGYVSALAGCYRVPTTAVLAVEEVAAGRPLPLVPAGEDVVLGVTFRDSGASA